MLGLRRSGQVSESGYGMADDLRLTYDGNRLKSVRDSAPDAVYGNGSELIQGRGKLCGEVFL